MPNMQLGISVPSTVVIVFNFYYMEFSPWLLQRGEEGRERRGEERDKERRGREEEGNIDMEGGEREGESEGDSDRVGGKRESERDVGER